MEAWQKFKGKSQSEMMYTFIHEAIEIVRELEDENILELSSKTKNPLKVKELRKFRFYIDCFPVIHREIRTFEPPFLTESYYKMTAPDQEASDDEGVIPDRDKFKKEDTQFYKQESKQEQLEYSQIHLRQQLNIETLKDKLKQINGE